ncbi:MAG: phage tail protein [Bacteroidetes bacterium]|nr:phage tail protein [Bacteroidota bacterium]MBU1720219.1 phage tail protein [Bacteroidota bacterium]
MAEEGYLVPQFHFEVSWTGVTIVCSEVSGLNSEIEVIEYRDGKSNSFYPTKRPGLQKFGDVDLKKAIFKDDQHYLDWYTKVATRDEGGYRDTVTIILKDENHNAVGTWTLENAWVSKFDMPDMNSTANEPAVESITVVCENITQEFNQ